MWNGQQFSRCCRRLARQTDMREVINALRYLVRAGCGWRMLPVHFGPWQTIYWWFRRLMRRMLFATLHDLTLMLHREREGRSPCPSGGVLDSQSIKAPQAKDRGYDAAKKTTGRKRQIAVGTGGRRLMIDSSPQPMWPTAPVPCQCSMPSRSFGRASSTSLPTALMTERPRWIRVRCLTSLCRSCSAIKTKFACHILPRRWVVERTFSWMIRQRRLVRDYEQRLDVPEAMIHIALGILMLRRLCV